MTVHRDKQLQQKRRNEREYSLVPTQTGVPRLCHAQWSNYGGARGGLAHLKDLAAPAKHVLRGFKGAGKRPPEIAR